MPGERLLPAYIGLGSNLDDPARQLAQAVAALGHLPSSRLVSVSSVYRNPPMGPADQPDYLNAVAGILTALEPAELLARLQAIEAAQGRRRDGERWGPRTLDLDLLLHGSVRLQSESLTLPHPGLRSRPFVLVPLAEIAPGLRLPDGSLVARLAAATPGDGLQRLAA
ncbi:MAG: 2-amino-4-hydroxy-6-hydroxymethyldihydropteridine diphosphokinase [Gammaproteobacteria bacterium]